MKVILKTKRTSYLIRVIIIYSENKAVKVNNNEKVINLSYCNLNRVVSVMLLDID